MNMSKLFGSLVLIAPLVVLIAIAAAAAAGPEGAKPVTRAAISGDPDNPRRHFRERNPARLGASDAARLYAELRAAMHRGYAGARLDDKDEERAYARAFPAWTPANAAPYLSVTHGNTYLNNYVNEIGAGYLKNEDAGVLPVGSIIAKDSFIAAKDGEVRPGPLFVMEKMPDGFNYVSGNWRYSMITPDGEFFGETRGQGAERVEYCIACHLAREASDHLYFVPKSVRPAP